MHARRPAASRAAALGIAALLLTAACGSSDDNSEESRPSASLTESPSGSPSATPSATATEAASAGPSDSASASPSASADGAGDGEGNGAFTPGVEEAADKVTVRLDLVDLRPTQMPEPVVRLDEGRMFSLVVRSDDPCEIHIHGYDKVLTVTGGAVERLTFVANLTGSFLVELHDNGKELFSLQVS